MGYLQYLFTSSGDYLHYRWTHYGQELFITLAIILIILLFRGVRYIYRSIK
jgi:hypothetical protein